MKKQYAENSLTNSRKGPSNWSRNKDDTDFRNGQNHPVTDCPFCYKNCKDRIVEEIDTVFAIKDGFPVSEGHLLIIPKPKRHTEDYFSLLEAERFEANQLVQLCRKKISLQDSSVTGSISE